MAGHAALLMTLMAVQPRPALEPATTESMLTAIVIDPPRPPPPPPPVEQPEPAEQPSKPAAAPAPAAPAPSAAAKRPSLGRPTIRARVVVATPPPDVEPLPVAGVATGEPSVILGAGDLAGAVVAGAGGSGGGGGDGSGGAGGRCDMVRRLQNALRDDPDIRSAVTRAHAGLGPAGKAILVWNGEWLKSPGQDGKGLAGVRQAIALEVAFAPAACRSQPMRGLALIAFSDQPGGPQLALGTGAWRWSDLLSARR